MYGKLFGQMYDGTLATKGPWQSLVTFQQLIILADKVGVVDMTTDAIARRTTIPLKVIQMGIDALQMPDPDSRTPDEEGRRIVRLSDFRDWGWRIVNYPHYRKLRNEDERREYHRLYARKRRAKAVSQPDVNKSTESQQTQPMVVSSMQYVVSSKETTTTGYSDRFEVIWRVYPKRAGGNSKADAFKAYQARLREGATHDDLLAGVERYAAFLRATGKEGSEFVKLASTFFGSGQHYAESWDAPDAHPSTNNGKPAWQVKKEAEERDQWMNKDPRITAAVTARCQLDDGQEWRERQLLAAQSAGRWAVPFAFDKLMEEQKNV